MEVTAVSDAAQRPALPEATSNEIPPLLLAGIGINNPLEARNISSEKKKKGSPLGRRCSAGSVDGGGRMEKRRAPSLDEGALYNSLSRVINARSGGSFAASAAFRICRG